MSSGARFVWVRSIGRYWLLPAELLGTLLLVVAAVLMILGRTSLGSGTWKVGAWLLAASLALTLLHHVAFFSLIRCPACGYNPTRTLAGKKMSVKTVHARLARYEQCPRCAGTPPADDQS
jgi:hypothetical protein